MSVHTARKANDDGANDLANAVVLSLGLLGLDGALRLIGP